MSAWTRAASEPSRSAAPAVLRMNWREVLIARRLTSLPLFGNCRNSDVLLEVSRFPLTPRESAPGRFRRPRRLKAAGAHADPDQRGFDFERLALFDIDKFVRIKQQPSQLLQPRWVILKVSERVDPFRARRWTRERHPVSEIDRRW